MVICLFIYFITNNFNLFQLLKSFETPKRKRIPRSVIKIRTVNRITRTKNFLLVSVPFGIWKRLFRALYLDAFRH